MRSPTIILEPPPSIREMMKVETDGTNTMVMPVVIPGTERGSTTRVKVFHGLAPRSPAASSV